MPARKRIRNLAVLPALFTLGNGACGFAACVKVASYLHMGDLGYLVTAAWLIFAAMLFDAFDGTIARLTKAATSFGGELDSLCDAVSFGIAPALLVVMWHSKHLAESNIETFWAKSAWFLCLLYAMAAILRLARFNVENAPDDERHTSFTGLPTPGAAGLVASLVILYDFLMQTPQPGTLHGYLSDMFGRTFWTSLAAVIKDGLPALMLALGFLMVSSRMRYIHVLNRIIRSRGKGTFDFLAYLFFFGVLGAAVRELALAGAFVAYAASGPIVYVHGLLKARGARRDAPSGKEDASK